MKRRVGLLAALAMCVTVGGVYATWNYADSNKVSPAYASKTVGLTVSGNITGESLKIESNSMLIKIDDAKDGDVVVAEGVAGDHYADTIVDTGNIVVRYDVAEGNNGTDPTLYCKVVVETAAGETAFLETSHIDGKFTKAYSGSLSGVDYVDYEITWADLGIDLIRNAQGYCEQVYLPTKAAYDAFVTKIGTIVTINLEFSLNPIQ